MKIGCTILALVLLVSVLPMNSPAAEHRGTVRLGYTLLDQDGNHSVNYRSFNIYEGVGVSLEDYAARLDNGIRIRANLKNITLKNRNLFISADKARLGGFQFRHTAFRRFYDFDGDRETTRYRTGGRMWFRPHEWFKVFGDIGMNSRKGEITTLFTPVAVDAFGSVDYTDVYYGGGVTFQRERITAQVEYRGSSYGDDISSLDDRTTGRFRATVAAPVPRFDFMTVSGGFQHYRLTIDDRGDTLSANTVWAGARAAFRGGYSLRYNVIFDRASRTGDPAATDNISHAVYGGKTFRNVGGLTVGFRYLNRDDVWQAYTGSSIYASGWAKPHSALLLRAGYGVSTLDIDDGRSLLGRRDRDRAWASARYSFEMGWVRLKVMAHETEYEATESLANYLKASADWSLDILDYGRVTGQYAYYKGDYSNSGGRFLFADHSVSGDITTTEYRHARLGFGGTYWRSRRDQDIESFSVRFTGWYTLPHGLGLEATYRSHTYDDLNDPSPVYTQYYTDNIVEVSVTYEVR